MANNELVINTEEFIKALRALPRELALEGAEMVHQEVEAAANEIRAAYPSDPEDTGNLRKGVKVTEVGRSEFGAVYKLRSNAPHAHLYEFGSELRFYKGASRGRMPKPPTPVFVPTVQRHRRAMYEALAGLVERAGFTVTGDVG